MDTTTTATPFASFIEQERARIRDAIKQARARQQEAEKEVTQLETELAAIAAYDAARKGKKVAAAPRAPRGRKGAKREALLALITEHPDGMTRAEIIEAMTAHGDKAAEQSISNALSALKRDSRLTQEGKKYRVREETQQTSIAR